MFRNFMNAASKRRSCISEWFRNTRFCSSEQKLQTDKEFDVGAEETKHGNRINDMLGKFTLQDQENILKIINNYKLSDLLCYDISKARANKLLAYRMRNGALKDIKDIFLIEGFGLKIADKFFQSLLHGPKSSDVILNKAGRVRTAPFTTPSLEAAHLQHIQSCVSVRVGVNSITWSKLELANAESNAPCLLSHWQHHEISEKKLHLNDLIQRCLYVSHLIPQADCYIFENPQMAQASNNPGSVDQQNINIQKAQVIAMMGYSLASRQALIEEMCNKNDGHDVLQSSLVFYVRRFLTARLFSHLVGTERVSSEQTVLNMMRVYYNVEEENELDPSLMEPEERPPKQEANGNTLRGNVQFPMELRRMFEKSPPYHREFLGQALLLNLAFVRLVLLQDPQSIAKVSRGGKGGRNDPSDVI